MTFVPLIDFWRISRKQQGLPCVVRPFHYDIADKLTDLVLGRLRKSNLMILMPPRCAKTDLGLKAFIPWAMSYFPDSEFILSSYGADLATDNSVACRNILSSDWYGSMVDDQWGATIPMKGSKAAGRQDHFFTEQGGVVKGVGRGGAVTGFGAGKLREEFGGALLIDDLLKASEATSAAARKDAVNYMTASLKSRRNRQDNPPTPTILIMQRLHPEDPAGYLLREEKEDWEVLQIPAHDDKEVIWPGRLNMQSLMDLMETDPSTYWAQYMQSPSQSGRTIFNNKWWEYWRDKAAVEKRITFKIITADTAFEEKTSADYSVFQCWGFENTSGMYLLDQIRGQWTFPDLLANAEMFWKRHSERQPGVAPASDIWIENKASGISLVQSLRKLKQIPARAWEPKERTAKDKVGRAKQSTFPIYSSRVYLPDPTLPGYKWVNNFVNEHSAFTDDDSHLHDDQVDTFTEACSIWQEKGGGTGPVPVW